MATIIANNLPVAIPSITTDFFYKNIKKRHPDILFEFPFNLTRFLKLFIIVLRRRFPSTGICLNNCRTIYFAGKDYLATPSIFIEQLKYYDLSKKKCFIGFNTVDIDDETTMYIGKIINRITKSKIYFNLHGKMYPNFYRLVQKYSYNIFQIGSNIIDSTYYGTKI